MSERDDVTQVLNSLESREHESADLLPLVYRELRRLAADRLRNERAGQTLQATALVHEAYLRLVDTEHQQRWDSRHHFFAAAAESMRRILIDNARRKQTVKHGGQWTRSDFDANQIETPDAEIDLLSLDEALDRLQAEEPDAALLVKLRYFSGLTVSQAAEVLDVSTRSAERLWTFARAWLFQSME
ncbi:ECF-type sigma factor [Planctomycetes bacterium K23_9]|uniref:ECF sigma factor n=1 Tax=Stieleria marina TaxID=1930275 RepID=A0A517NP89_9BACT|nr:ECF sigma factor [Planctomycetes bacterium K23_9]